MNILLNKACKSMSQAV